MNWMGLGLGLTLGAVLLSGCAGQIQPVGPAVDRAGLETRLAGLAARLDALEEAVAAEREARERGARAQEKTLAGVRRELKATKVALAEQRRQMAAPPPALVRRESVAIDRDAPTAVYRPVEVALGELPAGNGERVVRPIPAPIPSTAREILVYARVATGYVQGGPHQFRIATRLDGGREAAFYLFATGQPQQGWAYNSDNVWLPMPKDRELILHAEGEPFFGDWNSEVRIIGYR